MGLLPSSIKFLILFHQKYIFEGPVLTLGNQEVWATYDDLKKYFQEMKTDYIDAKEIKFHHSGLFRKDPTLARISEKFVHARVFFEMLGISEYYDVDKYDTDDAIYEFDLNFPVPAQLHEKFSLIIDGGTAEHIFDIRQVMENILVMLRPGGCIVHISSYNMDHGFYAISPCFYFDFYKVNGFTDFSCYILQINPKNLLANYDQRNAFFEYSYGMSLENLIDSDKHILVFFVAKRSQSKTSLKIPTQSIFDQSEDSFSCTPPRDRKYTFDSVVPAILKPLLQPFRPTIRYIYTLVYHARYHRSHKKGKI